MHDRAEAVFETAAPVPCPGPAALEGALRYHQTHSRRRLLEFLGTLEPEEFTQPLEPFQHHSVRDLLVHVIETERFWISVLANEPHIPFNAAEITDASGASRAWEPVAKKTGDLLRNADLEWFVNPAPFQTQEGETPEALIPSLVVLHVLTHEFHHKGQICKATRLLGHEPPDLDFL